MFILVVSFFKILDVMLRQISQCKVPQNMCFLLYHLQMKLQEGNVFTGVCLSEGEVCIPAYNWAGCVTEGGVTGVCLTGCV